MGSAYVMYVQMGFTTLAVKTSRYRCFSYPAQCPVLAGKLNKAALAGYDFLCLLVLKIWLLNASPPAFSTTSTVASAAVIWNARGFPDHRFLSFAFIPPLNNATSRSSTNAAYLQLLKVRTNVGRKPIKYYIGFGDTVLSPLPVHRSLSYTIRNDPHKKKVAGLNLGQADIRRYMFRSLVA
jgi:hypothetical protein